MIRQSLSLLLLLSLGGCSGCGDGRTDPDLVPPVPTGVTATTLSSTRVRVAWTDLDETEYGFQVEARLTGVGSFTIFAQVTANVVSADVPGLSPATSYEFRVVAWNPTGPSPASLVAAATTFAAAWVQLPDAPTAVQYVQSAYDSLRNRMILFGGGDDSAIFTDDLFALDFGLPSPSAVPITPGSAVRPGPRSKPTLIYDSRRDSLILFGGQLTSSGLPMNDLWEFNLTAEVWAPLSAGLTIAPAVRYGHSAIYDSDNGRMVIFGGFDDANKLGDVARLILPASGAASWEALILTSSSPSPRDAHSAIYDAGNKRMLVFAGNDNAVTGGGPYVNDIWSLPLSASPVISWSLLASAGSVPTPREGHVAVYDNINRQMVVFGGIEEVTFLPDDRVWTLSTDGPLTWTELSPLVPSPAARAYGTGVFDSGFSRMVVWGGIDTTFFVDIEVWALGL